MEISGAGKSPNTHLSFRYNANNEELEELFDVCDDEPPPSPPFDSSPTVKSDTDSPKKAERTPSIIDKYFKSMRSDKTEKSEDKPVDVKTTEDIRNLPKDVQSSPMKEYLKNLGKRNNSEPVDVKEGPNETWKIFHDFKFKIAQAVEDMKTRSSEDAKEKSVLRDSSVSDSEENSVVKDSDQSVGDTDNQVSSIESSMQNLSEMSSPATAKATEHEVNPSDKNNSDSSNDTHKNIYNSDTGELIEEQPTEDPHIEIESGVEALEDNIDGFNETHPAPDEVDLKQSESREADVRLPPSPVKTASQQPPSDTNLRQPPNEPQKELKKYFFDFTLYLLTFLIIANYVLFREWTIIQGFLLGIWSFILAGNLKQWFLDNYFYESDHRPPSFYKLNRSSTMPFAYTIPSVREHTPVRNFEGWVNLYRFPSYDPCTYHLNQTTTSFMKLEGCNLRISYTKTKVSKRALWDEKLEKVEFYQHRLYNLTGARVILLPLGLVRRRQWSKKYPICVILNQSEKIRILENKSASTERRMSVSESGSRRDPLNFEIEKESTETSTTPEKKKKFIWRKERKEKSMSQLDNDSGKESIKDQHIGKEGLRHRFVRKMHRDKKSDSVSTTGTDSESQSQPDKLEDAVFHDAETEPTVPSFSTSKDDDGAEDDIDEAEIARVKEFLNEAELDAGAVSTSAEGEWSIHVKQSNDMQPRLYIFTRTGRDKHEWFSRLTKSCAVAKSPTPDPSTVEEKQSNSEVPENKDDVEMTVLRSNVEKEVSFNRTSIKDSKDVTEKVTLAPSASTVQQSPTPKSPADDNDAIFWAYLIKIIQIVKNPDPGRDCRLLTTEVTWLNTVIARIAFDVMRNQETITRMQIRIQKKLNTIKIPSFMSPLVVTELNLAGACPLVERVSVPSWDERGIWLDMDLRYDGGAYIAVSTQINLMKLKEKMAPPTRHAHSRSGHGPHLELRSNLSELGLTLEEQLSNHELLEEGGIMSSPFLTSEYQIKPPRPAKAAVYDSELEDSGESSSDEENPLLQHVDSLDSIKPSDQSHKSSTAMDPGASSSKKKFLRIVDRIATNKYFQQVTDYKYIKRAMEGLSNTDIKLQVEVHGLEGRLVVNIPPPPHDRIWIAFRTNPHLALKARPAVGARTLKFSHISNWIEQKLSKEFEKVLVMPNMEDFIVNMMTPTPVEFE